MNSVVDLRSEKKHNFQFEGLEFLVKYTPKYILCVFDQKFYASLGTPTKILG